MTFKNPKVEALVNALNDLKEDFKSPQMYPSILISINSEFKEDAINELLNPQFNRKAVTAVKFKDVHPNGKKDFEPGCATCGNETPNIRENESSIVEIFEATEPEDTMAVISFFASDVELMTKFAKEHYQIALKPGVKPEQISKLIYQEYGKRKMASRMGR